MNRIPNRLARLAAPIVALLGLAGCVHVPLPPLLAEQGEPVLDADEQHLWARSVEVQHTLDRSGMILEDRVLSRYLAGIAEDLVGEELRASGIEPKVHVLSDVDPNIFTFPNGVVYVHSATLARLDDESELAALLAREFSHVLGRHALHTHRDTKGKKALMAAANVAAGTVQYGSLANLVIQVGLLTSMSGYAGVLEAEADARGLERTAAAGYDVRGGLRAFELAYAYQVEIYGQGKPTEPAMALSNVWLLTPRIWSHRHLLATRHADTRPGPAEQRSPARFRRAMRSAAIDHARLELDAGRFRSAEISARRVITRDARDADAWSVLGEALTGQRETKMTGPTDRLDGAIDEPAEAFARALQLDPNHARTHRAVGLSLVRAVRSDEDDRAARRRAVRHLRRYLAADPGAEDAAFVKTYIAELRRNQR